MRKKTRAARAVYRTSVTGGSVRGWMEEQYRKAPGLREEIAEMVAARSSTVS